MIITNISNNIHHIPTRNIANFFIKEPTKPKPKPINPNNTNISPVTSTLYPKLFDSFFLDFFRSLFKNIRQIYNFVL